MAELEPEHLRKVFIGGLHPDTTDDSLRDYFSKYGEIVDCIVMKDSQTKRSRGFGFVAFDLSSCVDQLQNERPHVLDGKEVDTKRVVPKESSVSQARSEREQKVNKVFIGGLRDQITEEDMKQYFSQFGVVERVETFTDKETGKKKGFGFVTFQDFDSVDKCVLQAQSTPEGKLNLQGFKVEVKKAKSQDEMRRSGPGGRGGGRGGAGGGRGGFNRGGGFGDYGQGSFNQSGYNSGGGYNQGGGGYGGGGYNQGGGNMGYGGGGGDNYSGGYNNGSNWGGSQQQSWGNSGGGGGYQQNGGGMGGMGGGYNSGASSGSYGQSSGGGPMRGGYNKSNRSGPYGGGGGGGGWRN